MVSAKVMVIPVPEAPRFFFTFDPIQQCLELIATNPDSHKNHKRSKSRFFKAGPFKTGSEFNAGKSGERDVSHRPFLDKWNNGSNHHHQDSNLLSYFHPNAKLLGHKHFYTPFQTMETFGITAALIVACAAAQEPPTVGNVWSRVSPAEADMDAAKLDEAFECAGGKEGMGQCLVRNECIDTTDELGILKLKNCV